MLYLNLEPQWFYDVKGKNLTLTNVVFEYIYGDNNFNHF